MELEWVILETSNYKSIIQICNDSLQHSLFQVLIGPPGVGKSTALQMFKNANRNEIILLIELDKIFTAKKLYFELLKGLGIYDFDISLPLPVLAEKLVIVLREGRKKLIIVDDASRAGADMLEYWQHVRKFTSNNTGIILTGTSKFKDDFDKWVAQKKRGIPELASRIMNWTILSLPGKDEILAVAKENGVTDSAELHSLITCTDFRDLYNRVIMDGVKRPKL